MTRFLTTKRYKCATVYDNQYSRLGYVHLRKSVLCDNTVEVKTAFEQYANDKGITIQGYCAENGIFKNNTWVKVCKYNKNY